MQLTDDITDSGFFGSEGGDGAEALDPAVIELVDELLVRAPGGREGLIRVLLALQQTFDRVSWRVQELVADRFDLSPAQVAGVVSYYPQLSAERQGRLKIDVCTGTGCFLCGGEGVLRQITGAADGRRSVDGEPSIAARGQRCLAVCGYGPVVRSEDRAHTVTEAGSAGDIVVDLLGPAPEPGDER
jgi:NADH:ubiquinone oxidoreductase subunit E